MERWKICQMMQSETNLLWILMLCHSIIPFYDHSFQPTQLMKAFRKQQKSAKQGKKRKKIATAVRDISIPVGLWCADFPHLPFLLLIRPHPHAPDINTTAT